MQTWTPLGNKIKSTLICIPASFGGSKWKGFPAPAVWIILTCTYKRFLVVNTLPFLLVCDYFYSEHNPPARRGYWDVALEHESKMDSGRWNQVRTEVSAGHEVMVKDLGISATNHLKARKRDLGDKGRSTPSFSWHTSLNCDCIICKSEFYGAPPTSVILVHLSPARKYNKSPQTQPS